VVVPLASRLFTTGGTYQIGDLKLFGGYSIMRSGSQTVADADNPNGATRQQTYWLGANYQISPAVTLIGGAFRANRNQGAGNGTLLTAGVNYYFSKRTLLYGTIGTVINGSNASFSVEAGGGKPTPGSSQQGVYTGIMHWF